MPDSVLHGDVAAFRLPAVLTFLSTARKSGTLTVASATREAWLYFQDGALVFAGSNQESFRLGSILLRKKKISTEQRDRIDELMHREGGRFGQLAVQENVLTEEQLRDFLKVQVSEILFDAMLWENGTFSFTHDSVLPSYAVTIAIDLPNLIMEGARRIDEWVEVMPRPTETTGLVFQFDQPDAMAPQSILLAVPPDPDQPWNLWQLQQGLLETLDMARIRAVDPDTLDEVGHYLPATHFAINTAGDTVSTDFAKLK